MSRYLMLASELYSLPILRPLAAQAQRDGHAVAWLCRDAIAPQLQAHESRIAGARGLARFGADATFATVHRIPPQLPGRKVQLFHGLSVDKRDDAGSSHFRIRGLFDLYCTHGPASTPRFQALAAARGGFAVAETGWSKLDPLFADAGADAPLRAPAQGREVVMLASTFTPALSAAPDLLPVVRELVRRGDRYWLLTLHPKCAPDLLAAYRALAGRHAAFLEAPALTDMLRAADVLVADTTSVVEEFALLEKPIVTLRHRRPRAFMRDIATADELDAALRAARARDPARMQAMREYAADVHPYRDGRSAERVLEAVEALLRGGPGARALRAAWWRRWQARGAMRALLPER